MIEREGEIKEYNDGQMKEGRKGKKVGRREDTKEEERNVTVDY